MDFNPYRSTTASAFQEFQPMFVRFLKSGSFDCRLVIEACNLFGQSSRTSNYILLSNLWQDCTNCSDSMEEVFTEKLIVAEFVKKPDL